MLLTKKQINKERKKKERKKEIARKQYPVPLSGAGNKTFLQHFTSMA